MAKEKVFMSKLQRDILKGAIALIWVAGIAIECVAKPFRAEGLVIITMLFIAVMVITETMEAQLALARVDAERRDANIKVLRADLADVKRTVMKENS
jgi:hypothetical protein